MTSPTATLHTELEKPRTIRDLIAATGLSQLAVATELGKLREAGKVMHSDTLPRVWWLTKAPSKPTLPPTQPDESYTAPLAWRARAVLRYHYEQQLAGRPIPTLREMVTAIGISSISVVRYHMERLGRHGLLKLAEPEVTGGYRVRPNRTALITAAGYAALGVQPKVRATIVIWRTCDRCGGCLPGVVEVEAGYLCEECRL